MTITGKGVAVALAVVIALAALFFGPAIFTPFKSAPATNSIDMTASADANPDATTSLPTTLQVSDISVGTGVVAAAGDTVIVEYVGALPDGTVFDASKNHGDGTFSFVLGAGKVIQGWDQGLVGMKEGGVRALIIPSSLGYGAQAMGSIPANSTLIFQVKLDKVEKGTVQ